jgi:predicted DNA-binding transcriptional regulator AlpA
MTSKYINSKAGLASECGVARSTIYTWLSHKDFPPETSHGWERVKVMEFAADALKRAAKAQTGTDADLKRRKLELQCEILQTELSRKRGELATEQQGTIPRPVAIEQIKQVVFAVWAAMDARITTLGNTRLKDNSPAYTCLCNAGTDYLQGAKKAVRRTLVDSPLKMTADEIDDCTTYSGGNGW